MKENQKYNIDARDIRLARLACPECDGVDALTVLALDVLASRDVYRDAYRAAVGQLHDGHLEQDRQRQRIADLATERRAAQLEEITRAA